jgi:hypothetical protein
MNENHDIRGVVGRFRIPGEFLNAAPYGNGHINDTYAAVFDQAGTRVRFIVQRINHNIFKNPVALMDNVQRVTSHVEKKIAGQLKRFGQVLTLIPTREGESYYRDEQGNHWRVYNFIEKARTYDAVESARQAFEAAKRLDSSRNGSPICRPHGCTTPFPISTILQNDLLRLKGRLKRIRSIGPNWRRRKLNLH